MTKIQNSQYLILLKYHLNVVSLDINNAIYCRQYQQQQQQQQQ